MNSRWRYVAGENEVTELLREAWVTLSSLDEDPRVTPKDTATREEIDQCRGKRAAVPPNPAHSLFFPVPPAARAPRRKLPP